MTDTLRSFCEQCTYLNNPQLDFVSGAQQRQIILRDIRALVSAASAELEKTVTILGGSIIESVLSCFLKDREDFIREQRGGVFQFPPQADLQDCVNLFNLWFRDLLPNVDLTNAVDYRNLVHIDNELNFPTDICKRASREMLTILNTLLGELSQFVNPQP